MTGKPNRKHGGAEPSPLTRLGIGCRFFRRAMSKLDGVLAGTDTFDGNNDISVLTQYADNAAVAQAIRQAAKRVIYNVVRTNAMNGMTISSITIKVTPWWQTALLATKCTLGALTAVSAGMLVASVVINRRKKSKSVPISSDD